MRRELAVIIGITALVVALVLLLGPQLTRVETGSPKPADSIPLPPLKSERPTPEPDQPQDLPPLRVEVLDAVTGRQIERDTAIDLTHLDGTWLDQMRGRFDGEPIGFTEPPIGRPLLLRLRLPGYVDAAAGPIVLAPGVPMVTRVKLLPLYRIDIVPRLPEGDKFYAVRVFSVTPPTWPETRPYSEWRAPVGGSAGFMLPPGRYWCQLPRHNPTAHTDYEDRGNWTTTDWLSKTPGYPITWPNFLFEFEVKDAPLTLAPEVAWPKGELMISGRLVNAKQQPQPRRRVLAIRMGPGCMREVAGSARTDEDGRFLLNGLLPGDYRIAEQEGEYNDGEEAVWLGRLKEAEPPPEVLLVTGRNSDSNESPAHGTNEEDPAHGSAEVRILRRGEPVPGARLLLEGFGTADRYWMMDRGPQVLWTADDHGVVQLGLMEPRSYVLRTSVPQTLQLFALEIVSGTHSQLEFEIAPEGTAELTGFIRFDGAEMLRCELDVLDVSGRRFFPNLGDNGTFEVFGIPPGKYRLHAIDTDRYEYHYEFELEFKADERLRFEWTEPSASVSGALPYPGFWKKGAVVEYHDALDDRLSDWSFSHYPPLEWEEGLNIRRVPRRKFTLVARSDYKGRVVGVAEVDTSDGDVSQLEWTMLYAPELGGSLQVVSSASVNRSPRTNVSLYVERDGLAKILLDRQPMQRRDQQVLCDFDALPPGSWTITLEARDYQTLTSTVLIEVGKVTRLMLAPVAAPQGGTESHDRPLDGVKIKLPPPASTGPPPGPEPALPREAVPPPLPPRPLANDEPLAGREVWLYPTGAEVAELWHALIHVRYGRHSRPIAVAESTWHLRASLVYAHGRPAILLQGLDEDDTGLTLRLPGREPVRVALVAGRSAYSVDVP